VLRRFDPKVRYCLLRLRLEHRRWQTDFKVDIAWKDGSLVNLHTVREPVGEACIGAFGFPAGTVGCNPKPVTLEQVRSALRLRFARWGTMPDQIQIDGESVLAGRPMQPFPSIFTLWLKGLDIDHLVIRPERPTDNAEVERCHRTGNDYPTHGCCILP